MTTQDTTVPRAHATETAERVRVFDVPLKNSLIEPKHFRRIGESLWGFVWGINRVTEEVLDANTGERVGLILGTMPQRDEDVAREIGCSVKTWRRWRSRLVTEGYFGCLRTPNGYRLWIRNSKKWASKEPTRKLLVSEWSNVSAHPKSDLPERDSRFPATGSRFTQKGKCNKTLLKTLPKTSPEERASRGAASVSGLEAKVLAAYQKSGFKPSWRDFERRALRELAEQNDPGEIVSALRVFLEFGGDDYLQTNGFPFAYFAKRFSGYRDQAQEELLRSLHNAFEADRFRVDPRKEIVEVEIATGPRAGRREEVHPDTAKGWFASGYARPCEQRGRIPTDVVEVRSYDQSYWIDRKKLAKYVSAGICEEVKG